MYRPNLSFQMGVDWFQLVRSRVGVAAAVDAELV
jgi:hypothetical protein